MLFLGNPQGNEPFHDLIVFLFIVCESVIGFCSDSEPLVALPNKYPTMAPRVPVTAVSCSSTLARIAVPWSNSWAENMSDVRGKVQLPARMAIPKKVCNALIEERV